MKQNLVWNCWQTTIERYFSSISDRVGIWLTSFRKILVVLPESWYLMTASSSIETLRDRYTGLVNTSQAPQIYSSVLESETQWKYQLTKILYVTFRIPKISQRIRENRGHWPLFSSSHIPLRQIRVEHWTTLLARIALLYLLLRPNGLLPIQRVPRLLARRHRTHREILESEQAAPHIPDRPQVDKEQRPVCWRDTLLQGNGMRESRRFFQEHSDLWRPYGELWQGIRENAWTRSYRSIFSVPIHRGSEPSCLTQYPLLRSRPQERWKLLQRSTLRVLRQSRVGRTQACGFSGVYQKDDRPVPERIDRRHNLLELWDNAMCLQEIPKGQEVHRLLYRPTVWRDTESTEARQVRCWLECSLSIQTGNVQASISGRAWSW